ncbi:MAG: tRNA (N6-threonylcarbamoyladenosine(37)-N6)-methyltransferase TrmO [Candidatus Altiarchaeales archaeon]|nr:tRNA (N6-threonylcarbamoyladenosine(37)-N6)-methyltransferase TrmO [Candidatus Altiarchaeales archaeon]
MEFTFKPIGVIKTGYSEKEGTPIQGAFHPENKASIELHREYVKGLTDLEGFSHIILLYVFHKAGECRSLQKPFLDDVARGVFAIRSPKRPNPLGLTTVKLEQIVGGTLHVSGVDVLDGTPLLDIKPYIPDFDVKKDVKVGWMLNKNRGEGLSDDRFS